MGQAERGICTSPGPDREKPGTPAPRRQLALGESRAPGCYSNQQVTSAPQSRIRVAAINFLNPAPLMWDFELPPLAALRAERYVVERMMPSECADRLAAGSADIGLVPVAALATNPSLRVLPGCTIASKHKVRSLLFGHRAVQKLTDLRRIAADTASRTTIAYARILLQRWGNAAAELVPMRADLDAMLARADAAILIGDPALMALEERANRFERTGEELVYLDLAEEWRRETGLPFVSAIWATAGGRPLHESGNLEAVTRYLVASRDHGLAHIDDLVDEWSRRLPLSAETIRTYLSENIHYVLDEECLEGMRGFFRMAADAGVLPGYQLPAIR